MLTIFNRHVVKSFSKMTFKQIYLKIYDKIDKKFEEQFGFPVKDVTFNKVVDYLHVPKDSSSLAVTRILFGLAMMFDIPDERGGAVLEKRWGNPRICHFPLFPFITAAPLPVMASVYASAWIGAVGIMLGYKYQFTSTLFTVCHWYLLLIEKSFWNNHSYLFGLVAMLLSFTQANCYWSLDVYLNPELKRDTVPYWNYFLLKYQFFILYFMAGLKKGTAEWLTGYSVQKLSEHWVFEPFKLFMDVPDIDYYIVHWFIFVFDLTVAVWMMWSRTRNIAMAFCALFHLMNSRLFRIGMFPWVCLATMPLFYPFDWPKRVINFFLKYYMIITFRFRSDKSKALQVYDPQNIDRSNDHENDDITDDKIIEKNNDIEHVETIYYKSDENEKYITHVNEESPERKDGITTHNDNENDEQNHDHKNVEENDQNLDEIDVLISAKRNKEENFKTKVLHALRSKRRVLINNDHHNERCVTEDSGQKKKLRTCLIIFYVLLQLFLPYSHFITKGYNNWTNGLYGYSWDMMVHTWDTKSVVVKVVDNNNSKEYFLDPHMYALNDRWTRHGDMVYQYAQCLKKNLIQDTREKKFPLSKNISIYVDVWCSLNGRFTQRLFDSKVDLLKTTWSPFKRVPFLIPLLDEALGWRTVLDSIREHVMSWGDYSEVIFYAELPGYALDKFMSLDLLNVTLTVLKGPVALETDVDPNRIGQSFVLHTGNITRLQSGYFHKVLNIGNDPAYYMYTFENLTEITSNETQKEKPKLPIFKEIYFRMSNMVVFAKLVLKNIFSTCFWLSRCL